jgi:hypothetical protein
VTEVDYVGVREFIALILSHRWEPRGAFEYLRLSMLPDLVQHLPRGIVVDYTFGPDDGGMIDVRLRRLRGWKL